MTEGGRAMTEGCRAMTEGRDALFVMEAKRFSEICPHVVQASDSLAAFVALGVLSCAK